MQFDTKVMVMGLDAATTGRMNISMYTELMSSDFLRNIEQWHSDTAWNRFNGKKKMRIVNSFGLYEIAKYAFGTEQGAFIDCDKKVMRDTLLRLIPCVTEGREVPADIMHGLYAKASNPLAYDNSYNHNTVLETACGMIRRSMIKETNIPQEGEYLMAYVPNITDRSYLYGCLLAIADKAEGEAYDASERNVRVTNARRYWNTFSQRPYSTWGVIYERLNPYINKLGKASVKYEKRIQEISEKMSFETFSDDSRLDNTYLLGYSHYTTFMFNEDSGKNKEEK
jgi:CRISPR-associated protein Csd1